MRKRKAPLFLALAVAFGAVAAGCEGGDTVVEDGADEEGTDDGTSEDDGNGDGDGSGDGGDGSGEDGGDGGNGDGDDSDVDIDVG